jgi:tetratricopeptide (TPR) repeat protein
MKPGDLIADRFEVERLAGWGGMAAVYRALDRFSGEIVALKLLHGDDERDAARFNREAQVLASLHHPGIVRYVAHGRTASGQSYLAMEWLEGEDLASRLAGDGLTIDETLTLATVIADALGAAHAQGIVHRDITPANVFLPNHDYKRAKMLDFGIARVNNRTFGTTRHGVVLGTLWYMSPEHAKGAPVIDARADVFALGCVMFECIAGRPPFMADDIVALLAKVLLEETPSVRALRPQIPPAIDALLTRMLSKDPKDRPADGKAVGDLIRELGSFDQAERRPSVRPAALTASEQRLVCVVVASPAEPRSSEFAVTAAHEVQQSSIAALRAAVEPYGARLETLLDGSVIATPQGSGPATDQAVKAARCALAMRALLPDMPIALATGKSLVAQSWPVGQVIDRAVRLLRANTANLSIGGNAPRPQLPIRVDEATAGLLSTRFDIRSDSAGLILHGEREQAEATRTLLGRPSPCVGRERELGALVALWDECVAEPLARPVLVTGPAGVGKSRLRHEFLRTIHSRGAPVTVWVGRGDPLRAGSPFGMLAPALRAALGVLDGEPIDVRRDKLLARVARRVPAGNTRRVTEFLGEMLGIPTSDDDASVQLRTARSDAMIMGDQMRRAWADFVAAECAAQPVLIVLEDLHWGDLPSVQFLDLALRQLTDQPLMVLVLARPEVHDLFPNLWTERNLQPVPLGELSRKAAEKLVKQILGEQVDPKTLRSIVDRANGNAFYLEVLIRAVAEGKGDDLPETVLAMVQERLQRLDPEARRVLRAASVFGQVFWQGGMKALLGGERSTDTLESRLNELCERELVVRRGDAKFPGEHEYAFRHALVRDAAYTTLTENDRQLGHRLAGDWLERAGESDAITLAEHFERGGDLARSVRWFQRAAEQALEGNDFASSITRAQRGIDAGAQDDVMGALLRVQAEAHKWRGDYEKADATARAAMDHLPAGSAAWFSAAGEGVMAAGRLGHYDSLAELAQRLLGENLSTAANSAQLVAGLRAVIHLLHAGRYELAEVLLDRIAPLADARSTTDPLVSARYHQARGHRALFAGDPGACAEHISTAAQLFERAGDLRAACLQRASYGYACMEVGAYAEAETALRDALATAEHMGLNNVIADAKHNLGYTLARREQLAEAKVFEQEALEAFRARRDRRMEGGSCVYLALICAMANDLAGAEAHARAGLDVLTTTPPMRVYALAVLAHVHLLAGRADEALRVAKESIELLGSLAAVEAGESLIRLVYAEALRATGDRDAARAAIRDARDRLLERAAKVSDPARRASFLERVPENARTLTCARAWE